MGGQRAQTLFMRCSGTDARAHPVEVIGREHQVNAFDT
jgi:hypothetical protein